MNKSMNKAEEGSGSMPQGAMKPYAKPLLSNLGSLRDLTMTMKSSGASDGKNKRFTGRGSWHVDRGCLS